MKKNFLPYYNERPNNKINSIVIHCSAHKSDELIDVLLKNELSSHYVIGLEGEVIQTVPDEKRAWHAGVSSWRELDNLNDTSIGIELSSLSLGQTEYPMKQMQSLLKLCKRLIKKYNIPAENVVAHSDIAPTRKPDPGCYFPWEWLAKNGVGIWYNLENYKKVAEKNVAHLLRAIGYNVENLAAAQYAFCRHFIPQNVVLNMDIKHLVDNPFEEDFNLNKTDVKILKACYFAFNLKKD